MTIRGCLLASGNVLEVGCDYLTTTWHSPMKETVLANTKYVMDWVRGHERLGGDKNKIKPWAWQGYIGLTCGGVSCGERPDGSILRLSSVSANEWLKAGLPAGHNISRFDVAATVWGVYDQSAAIARHKEETLLYRKTLHNRRYQVRLEDGTGDGDTLYCGSRDSEYYLRIYDKEREKKSSAEYKGALRYEAECKEELARQAYQGCTDGGYSVSSCMAVLDELLDRRGISPVYPRGVQRAKFANREVSHTDLGDTVAWLSTQVRPTLKKWWRAGYEKEMLDALGLGELWELYRKCN